jgi:hypothetical protein
MLHPLRVVAPVLALAAALTACSGSGSSTPDAGSTPPPPHTPVSSPTVPQKSPKPPVVGACYRLGYDEALAPVNDKASVPCTGTHTAVTFYVGTFGKSLAVDGDRVHRLESTVCASRFAAFVGGSVEERRLSMLRTVWFTPTVQQAGLGAHWFQCAAIALRGDQNLALLRGPLKGVLASSTGRGRFALCGTAEPGTTGFEQRICTAPHSWRALSTVALAAGPYPGTDKVKAAGQGPCQDAGRAVAGNPLSYRWSYQWPSLQQWRAGQTYGVCWAPS